MSSQGAYFVAIASLETVRGRFRLGIDKDKLLPISKGDEKKVVVVPIETQEYTWLTEGMVQAFAMLERSSDVFPSEWK